MTWTPQDTLAAAATVRTAMLREQIYDAVLVPNEFRGDLTAPDPFTLIDGRIEHMELREAL